MRILFIGDIVARPGRETVKEVLPKILREEKIDFTVANAENIAHGRGATEGTLRELMDVGIDFFTSGDHIFWQKGFEDEIDSLPLIRPANLPPGQPGKGYEIVDTGKMGKVLLINLQGRVFLNERVDDPFRKADEILEEVRNEDYVYSILDFHAEASSEKYALAFYLDGRVNAIVGTHTHVPTCDGMVLPGKTLYISDIGMSGIIDSVLGVEKDIIIKYFLTGQNQRFQWENTGTKAFRGVVLDTEQNSITRIDQILNER
jgi:hypothetical protein